MCYYANPCQAPTATTTIAAAAAAVAAAVIAVAAVATAAAAATLSVQLPQREHVARTGGLRHIDRPESAAPVDAFTSALVSSLKALVRYIHSVIVTV